MVKSDDIKVQDNEAKVLGIILPKQMLESLH